MAPGKKKAGTKKVTRKVTGKSLKPDTGQTSLGFDAPPPASSDSAAAARAQKAASFSPVARRIRTESSIIQKKILLGEKPSMKFPLRTLANVTYNSGTGFFKLKGKTKERTLTVNTVKTFAQTLKMMALSKELVETDDIATKREAY